MFRSRASWVRFRTRFKLQETRAFCSNHTKSSRSSTSNNSNELVSSVGNYDETYRQLDKLDFMTAAKILFTDPPKKKKFGIDFHLVQLFFACMPSLAVYLVAQYARYEMRKMEAELEQKKKREEEEKAKEEELNAREEKEKGSDPELQEVKVRLDKLEEAVKEIVVESKKQSGSDITKNQEDNSKKKQLAVTEPRDICDKSKSISSAEKEQLSKQKSIEQTPPLNQGKTGTLTPILDASKWDQKGKNQHEGSSRNAG